MMSLVSWDLWPPPHNVKLRQGEPEPGTLEVDGDGRSPRRAAVRSEPGQDGRATVASRFREQPLLNGLLVVACIAVIVIGYTAVGPASQSSGQRTRTATAKSGVVQSTVSGSGNIQSADQLNLGFRTSGTVTHIYVKQGEHVAQGQLLATLDPQSAEVSLEQAKATLQSSEASLARLEENDGESTSGQGSSATGTTASAASTTPTGSTTPTSSTSPTAGQHGKSNSNGTEQASKATETTPTSSPAGETGSSSGAKQSAATREANLASARAAVKSDKLAVQSAEQAVSEHEALRAPERHDRDALGRSRRNRVGHRHHAGGVELEQLIERRLQRRRRHWRQSLDRRRLRDAAPRAPVRATRPPPRSRSSATSNRCSSWSR